MITQEDLQIITRNSSINQADIQRVLTEKIYHKKKDWQQFLALFFMSLGVGLSVVGIVFFFAYNWDDLHKFTKLGIIEILIVALTLIAVFAKIKPIFKNILLTGASMLVGVLFAVFGQIYQTGANAYDFFLGWTMAVALWVLISNFAVLWLLFLVLINVTFGFYVEQVAPNWSDITVYSIFIAMNAVFLLGTLFLKHKKYKIPKWFEYILALSIILLITAGMFEVIFSHRHKENSFIVVFQMLILYSLGIYYGFKEKKSFYLALIPLSIIILLSAFFVEQIHDKEYISLLFIGLFVVVSVTFLVKYLMNLQKQWKDEK